ncbi:MAG: RES family NAD+ phosphorylase [Gammaproteobacteria bacterium]|nr:RES family NAD+ phosphorylase [Gammaproteobacteria bacterium]
MAGWLARLMIPTRRERWSRAIRIIPSHFPPIDLFEEVADPADLEAVHAVEALTNPRLLDQVGELALVPADDRISGPGSSVIMAAFTHPNRAGSRFSAGEYGVYYAAADQATAISETRYHRERFLRLQDTGPQRLHMRAYVGAVDADWLDLRGLQTSHPELYDADDYRASQVWGRDQRERGAWGVLYDSVRHPGGQCLAAFKPKACRTVRQGGHFEYYYDGQRITHVARLTELRNA